MRKTIKTITILAIFSIISCKKEELSTVKIDANNMIVPTEIVEVNKAIEALNIEKIQSYPIIQFAENEFDFGIIKDGDKVEHTYKFTNVGKSDLIVINATATCGCTVPSWTKNPVKPGETGEIKIEFNSTGRTGMQQKYINLVTNTEPGNESVSFKAQVNPK